MLGLNYKILIIDDDEVDIVMLRRMLDSAHEVMSACSAAEARALLQTQSFDCALVDYELPDTEGWDLVQELSACDLAVVVLTGHDDDEFGVLALQAGAQDYITKSEVTAKLLRRSLRYAVERAQSAVRMMISERERKDLERQFHQAQKMEAIGRLAGGVAHDFNNLLTAIIGFSRFVLDDLSPGDHRRDDLIHVLKAADRAETLTRQLLAFSRKQAIEPRVLSLNELIKNVEKLIRRTIGEHIDISLGLSPALNSVKVDAAQFEQVLMNMAVNARDAMPNGGRLRIETRNEGETVVVAVTDEGMGMSPEVQAQIFEPFFTTKDRNSGTGLGLATCYGIIQQAGGEIAVESALGRGSTFLVSLPRSQEPVQTLQEPANDVLPMSPGRSHRVLVVEDDDRVRALTVRMLRKHGYVTIEASSAREGRDIFDIEGGEIEAVVTDLMLPDGRGSELAAFLCSRDPSVRVLFMTGYEDDAIEADLLERIPIYRTVRKPFVERTLLQTMAELFDAPMPSLKPGAAANQRPKVLLVDDDAGIRRTYKRMLGDSFDVEVLDDNMNDVLELLQSESFDLVIFDVIMPRVSGFDLAERARDASPRNAQRIFHMTGLRDDSLVEAYAKQNNEAIISKPLTVEKLNALLTGSVSRAQRAQA
ncbi:MAG: response regulator [Myxococcota bacterium]